MCQGVTMEEEVEIFYQVKRSVRKCVGTWKRLFSVSLVFRLYTCGILEKQHFFPRNCFAHKIAYAYMSLFMNCWNIQENMDADLFWAGDGRFCGIFLFLAGDGRFCGTLFHFGATQSDLLLFLLDLRTAFFKAHLLSPWRLWQLWFPKCYKVFMEPPYTIVTP